jgi:hypothetical protein
LFSQAGLPDRGTELAQLVPDLLTLARTVTIEPIRRRRHADIMPQPNPRHTRWLSADASTMPRITRADPPFGAAFAAWWIRPRSRQNWAICAHKANCERPVVARRAAWSARCGWLARSCC